MQQNDSKEPVHIFVMCDDAKAKANIDASLGAVAQRLGLHYDPAHLHLIPWDTGTFWTRDYGPWWMQNPKTGSYAIVKHTYTTLGGGSVGLVEGALSVYRDALPGYTVVGIPSKPEFPWLGTDAMHCRTRGVPREVVQTWLKALEPASP